MTYFTAFVRNCVAFLVLASCGSPKPEPTPSPTLASEIERIEAIIPLCDGLYSRPSCDLGDSMTLAGAMARIHPDKAREQILASIASDGQPFRSPKHLQRALEGDSADDVTSKSFSRDHVISVLFYTVFTKDPEPLNRIWSYSLSHGLTVCPGSASQCALTPAILDQIGDAFAYCGQDRPWQTHVPGAVSAVTQMVSVPSISSWQLTLAAEHVLLKTITGNLNFAWRDLANQVSAKAPNNLFYKYVSLASNGKDTDELVELLLSLMRGFTTQGKQWVWNDMNTKMATGYDYILLADLITKGID